jgi:hypothetical protein
MVGLNTRTSVSNISIRLFNFEELKKSANRMAPQSFQLIQMMSQFVLHLFKKYSKNNLNWIGAKRVVRISNGATRRHLITIIGVQVNQAIMKCM